eukprot:UN08249
MADLLGPVRMTNWGEFFNVRAEPDSEGQKDLAYTAEGIPPHTDQPYLGNSPGFQWSHCLENNCT